MLARHISSSSRLPPAPVGILTEVQHGWDETPSDDELAALEQLLQPLFGLFTQFSHVFILNSEDAATTKDKEAEVT
ncbi:hypothetical protein KUCAC02_010954 [Chaenocephalus aceratus]|uniref:Uncharacterized protein n=1 Tax=Chaenocephalus aceratus TaxID=36190 RepID=A0ACB9WVY2_CHAAC|nr:hypothetical protein KUCAC02_010954 [Chaenocephalus aceratus]